MEYRVTWTIDLDAETHEEAARLALDIQRDSASLAGHFMVIDEHGDKREVWAEKHPP